MNEKYIKQIKDIIRNIEDQKKYIPYYSDLENHQTFWSIFKTLNKKSDIEKIIDEYIVEFIYWWKTKWWQLMQRCFEINKKDFLEFRQLNWDKSKVKTKRFQELGKKVEKELYKYEDILTWTMLTRPQWLNKTINAFYSIAYKVFPLLNEIE